VAAKKRVKAPYIGHNSSAATRVALRAAERLEAVAERTIAKANEEIARPRLENTARRARMASGVTDNARAQIAHARTALRIADALRSGEAGALANVKSLADVRELSRLSRSAMYNADRALNRRYDPGRAPSVDDLKYAKVDKPNVYISHSDVDQLRAVFKGTRGFARDLDQIRSLAGERETRGAMTARRIEALERVAKAVQKLPESAADKLQHRHQLRSLKYTAGRHLESIRDYKRAATVAGDDVAATLRAYMDVRANRTAADPIKALETKLIGQKIPGYYQTPIALAERMARIAGIKPGMTVLEPSAGAGRLADAVKKIEPGATVQAVEQHATLRQILEKKGHALIGSDFNELEAPNKFDRVIMNPPFEKGQDMQHVRRAFDKVKPGGKVVAIMGEGAFFRSDKQATEFRTWLQQQGGRSEKLPAGTFKESGTGVNTRLVTIEKAAGGPAGGWSDEARAASATARLAEAGKGGEVARKPVTDRIDDVGEKIGGARKDQAKKTGKRRSKAKTVDPRPAWARRFVVTEQIDRNTKQGTGKFSILDVGKNTRWGGRAIMRDIPSLAEAEARIPLAAVSQKHRVYKTQDGQYAVFRNVSDRKRVQIGPSFPDSESAMKHMAANPVQIIETKTGFGEEILKKPDDPRRSGPIRRPMGKAGRPRRHFWRADPQGIRLARHRVRQLAEPGRAPDGHECGLRRLSRSE
jgi:predicted RNA methylase